MKKVFLDNLPKWKEGNNKGQINWLESVGNQVNFIYNDVKGVIDIVDFDVKSKYLIINYLNNKNFKIKTSSFIRCMFGNLLNKFTSNFKIEIGTRFNDGKRDITITDRQKIRSKNGQDRKYYKYKCNKCGFDCGEHWSIKDKEFKEELWVEENSLISGRKNGCSCCCNPTRIVVEEINSIYKTDKWMIPIINNEEFCKTHTYGSTEKIYPTCSECGRVKNNKMAVSTIYRYHSINCTCSDSISYGEKILFNILEQLGINFQIQLTKTTFNWCQNYKYDFYFELHDKQYICEVNGSQHYENSFGTIDGAKSLEEEIENDRLKKELAIENGIKEENYIVIDCRKSELRWIRNNITESKLAKLLDLSKVNWVKAEEFALSNLIKKACEIKRDNPDMTTTEISIKMNFHRGTIRDWLKKGMEIGWCMYSAEEEARKVRSKNGKTNNKFVVILKNNICLDLFKSVTELTMQSKHLFGIKLNGGNISNVCNNKKDLYKGYHFKYIKDLTSEEYIKYDIENKLKELHNRELVQAC